jgi:sulfur dioxygenase
MSYDTPALNAGPLAGVALSGEMTAEQTAAAVAAGFTSWLFLNPDCKADECGLKAALVDKGVAYSCVPVDKDALTVELAAKAVAALDSLAAPVMIQCSTATRAGAVLLLSLAKARGLNYHAAMQLAADMELKFAAGYATSQPAKSVLVSWVETVLSAASPTPSPPSAAVEITQLFDDSGSSTYTYLLTDVATKQCVLIDPVLEQVERDLVAVDAAGLTLVYAINTHAHADHITGSGKIKALRPEVKSIIATASAAKADITVADGEAITWGSCTLTTISTPGHTEGCVCYHLAAGTSAGWLFSGDALLIRGCGRTDFQGGSAPDLFSSVREKIFTLPEDTVVAPAHDYKDRNVSTIGDEMRWNPRLQLSNTLPEFEAIMLGLNLQYPKKLDVAVPANMMCGAYEVETQA